MKSCDYRWSSVGRVGVVTILCVVAVAVVVGTAVGGAAGSASEADGATAASLDVTVNTTAGSVAPGENLAVSIVVANTGDSAAAGLVVNVTTPERWRIVGRTDAEGVWRGRTAEWFWADLPPGERVTPAVTVRIPANASGEFTVAVSASTGRNVTDQASVTTRVGAATTANGTATGTRTAETGTTTVTTGGDGGENSGGSGGGGGGVLSGDSGVSTDGFTGATAGAAVLLLALLSARRGRE